MTREEREVAIKVIRNFPVESTGERKAVLTAIKALEQEPCPNAISRSDMLDAVGHGRQYTSEELQKIIKALPSVNPLSKDYNTIYYTPQPKTGHWIDDTRLGYHVSICSNCNWRGHGDTCLIYKPKYCPNCGAKMIEPQESEDKCKNCEYYHNPDYTRCHKCKAESEE